MVHVYCASRFFSSVSNLAYPDVKKCSQILSRNNYMHPEWSIAMSLVAHNIALCTKAFNKGNVYDPCAITHEGFTIVIIHPGFVPHCVQCFIIQKSRYVSLVWLRNTWHIPDIASSRDVNIFPQRYISFMIIHLWQNKSVCSVEIPIMSLPCFSATGHR